jgi:yeast amino acid transporter
MGLLHSASSLPLQSECRPGASVQIVHGLTLQRNYEVFIPDPEKYGDFDYKNFITGYLGIPLYLFMIAFWKIVKRTKRVRPSEADLYSGKKEIDDAEAEFLAAKAAREAQKGTAGKRIYRFFSWLF